MKNEKKLDKKELEELFEKYQYKDDKDVAKWVYWWLTNWDHIAILENVKRDPTNKKKTSGNCV